MPAAEGPDPRAEVAGTRRGYDLVAGDYAAAISGELAGKPFDRALLDTIVELAAGFAIADVGCGPGHVTRYLADRGARVVVGLDLSTAMAGIGARTTGLPFVAADMTAVPLRSASLGGVVSLYAVIHLDAAARAAAYREFARVLRPGGYALIAFHTSDADTPMGGRRSMAQWWGHRVDLTFRFLDPDEETRALAAAGLEVTARLDREPLLTGEHASRRSYLVLRRAVGG